MPNHLKSETWSKEVNDRQASISMIFEFRMEPARSKELYEQATTIMKAILEALGNAKDLVDYIIQVRMHTASD